MDENFSTRRCLTSTEVAARFNVCSETIRREFRRGHIMGIRIGGHLRFSEDDIAEYIEQQRPKHLLLQKKRS